MPATNTLAQTSRWRRTHKSSRFLAHWYKANDLLVNAFKKFDACPGEKKTVELAPSGCRTRRRRRLGQPIPLPKTARSMRLWCLGKTTHVSIKKGRRYSAQVPNPGGARRPYQIHYIGAWRKGRRACLGSMRAGPDFLRLPIPFPRPIRVPWRKLCHEKRTKAYERNR